MMTKPRRRTATQQKRNTDCTMRYSQKKKRPLSIQWKLGLVLLSIVHCALAQEPTASPAPSTAADIDTSMPTTPPVAITPIPTKSEIPSGSPSSSPTLSHEPSYAPTVSSQPTVSEAPSSFPTVSAQPTVTKMPTNNPTTSEMPTSVPSEIPSVVPSAPPEIITAETFNNRMVFDGLPFLLNMSVVPSTNMTGNVTWTNITSEHVITYWRNRNYTTFNITSVVTNVINQFPEPINPEAGIIGSRVIYDQQIRYTSWGSGSPVSYAGNESVLFLWPFQFNSQPYVDRLMRAFQPPSKRIHMLDVSLARQPPPEPTMAPNGLPPFMEPDNGKMETPMIVAIALGSVAAFGIILFILIWWITRRKPDIIFNEDFVDHAQDDMMLVPPPNEDPRVFVPASSSSRMTASDITSSSRQQGGPYSSQILAQQQELSERKHSIAESTSDGNLYIEDDEQDESLHVGVPVPDGDDDDYTGSREEEDDDEDDDDDDDSYYYQRGVYTESIAEAHRPSMTAFGLQISELED